jgi:hypothetical protein
MLMTRILSAWCPLVSRPVRVSFWGDAWDGRAEDVVSCTAFVPPASVTCGKPCRNVDKLVLLTPDA